MRNVLRTTSVLTALIAFVPTVAHAHPGHDGGDITWDFSHWAQHPIATVICLVTIGGAAWVIGRLIESSSDGTTARERADRQS